MKILFVGSNPSNASGTLDAFDALTKSARTVRGWLNIFDDSERALLFWDFTNVARIKKEGNKPLTAKEIDDNLFELQCSVDAYRPDKIVALGKTAAKALTLLRLPFYEMPHPSGLNRQLNDPEFVARKLKDLKEYILQVEESTNLQIKSTEN
jgi:uracil-DNA glycosylase